MLRTVTGYRVTYLQLNYLFQRGFSKDLLSVVFSHAVLGNSVVAILAGLVAQGVASQFGFV